MHRANHVVKSHEVRSPDDTKDDGAEKGADEALKRLLWRKLDKWGTANCNAPKVGKDVIADNKRCRHPEPDKTFKNVVYDKMTADIYILSEPVKY